MFGRKRIQNLQSYVVYLLLNDEFRTDEKEEFLKFIAKEKPKVKDPARLTFRAFKEIEDTTTDLLGERGSLVRANVMIWNFNDPNDIDYISAAGVEGFLPKS